MKKSTLGVAIATTAILLTQAAQADAVKGSARADFTADELVVPCVAIEGYSEAADGTFFDLIFDRRGNSFNYELKFGEPEDAAVCEELANYAIFIDEDADDDEGEPEDDIFASCEVTHVEGEQVAASISVMAKNLEAGDFYAVVSSGENTLTSETKTIEEDEVGFEFSSNEDEVLDGAEAIEAGFIVDAEVTAELFGGDDVLVLGETVSCVVKQEDADEEEEEEEEEGEEA